MKSKNISWGIFLIFIGIVLLLANLGIIGWSVVFSFFDLWPLIIIIIGLGIIFKEKPIIKTILWILFFTTLIGYGFMKQDGIYKSKENITSEEMSWEKTQEIVNGELNISLGAGIFDIGSEDDKLLKSYISDKKVKHNYATKDNEKTAVLDFTQSNKNLSNFNFDFNPKDMYDFKLNKDVVWDIDIDTGAVDSTFDMSELKVAKLDADMGACDFELIFGDKCKKVEASIDGGAMDIDIVVPKNAGIKVDYEGALSGGNLKNLGLKKIDGVYVSDDYENADVQIDFDINLGVSSLNFEFR